MIPKLARANEFTLTRTGLVPAHAEKFTIVVIDADKGKTRQRGHPLLLLNGQNSPAGTSQCKCRNCHTDW